MALCQVCREIDFGRWIEKCCFGSKYIWRGPIPHQTSEKALRESAASGCPLCLMLLEDHRQGRNDSKTPPGASTRSVSTSSSEESISESASENLAGLGSGSVEISPDPSSSGIAKNALMSPCGETTTQGRQPDRRFGLNSVVLRCHGSVTHDSRTCVGFTYEREMPPVTGNSKPLVVTLPTSASMFKFHRGSNAHGQDYVGCRRPGDLDINLWRSWIDDCQRLHPSCTSGEMKNLPTRVIDLEGTPRLVESHGRPGHYVALSHCWGSLPPLKTTAANYAAHLAKIPSSDLPATFRDAAQVTLALGYRYLWIDSLCIIQGDTADWQSECGRMHAVYANSAVTIAAVGATDSSAGLFVQSPTFDGPEYRLDVEWPSSGRVEELIILGPIPFTETSVMGHDDGPLTQRAWAVQERVLSSRVLNFSRRGVSFECNSVHCLDEVYHPLVPDFKRQRWLGFADTVEKRDIHAMDISERLEWWYGLLQHYSKCKLTEEKDRLPALSGLAHVLTPLMPGQYVAGLWTYDIAAALAWYTNHDHPDRSTRLSSHPAEYRGPSWSWVGRDCGVYCPAKDYHYPRYVADVTAQQDWLDPLREMWRNDELTNYWIPCITLAWTTVKALDEDRFSDIESGVLALWGAKQPVTLEVEDCQENNDSGSCTIKYLSLDHFGRASVNVPFSDLSAFSGLCCVLLGVEPLSSGYCICRFLLLRAVNGSHQMQRIECFTVPIPSDRLDSVCALYADWHPKVDSVLIELV